MIFLVASGTAGHVPERTRKNFMSESGFKKKPRLNKIKFIRRSKLPGNGAKFDSTQITLKSELLSQIGGSDVVLRDQIHRDSRITQ